MNEKNQRRTVPVLLGVEQVLVGDHGLPVDSEQERLVEIPRHRDRLHDRLAVDQHAHALLENAVLVGTASEDEVGVTTGLTPLLDRGGELRLQHASDLTGPPGDVPGHGDRLVVLAFVPEFEAPGELGADLLVVRRDDHQRPVGLGRGARLAPEDHGKKQHHQEAAENRGPLPVEGTEPRTQQKRHHDSEEHENLRGGHRQQHDHADDDQCEEKQYDETRYITHDLHPVRSPTARPISSANVPAASRTAFIQEGSSTPAA